MRPCSAIQPFTDETTTTVPPPAAIMSGKQALVPSTAPKKLSSNC